MSAPLDTAAFAKRWTARPDERADFDRLFSIVPARNGFVIVDRVGFSDSFVLEDVLGVDEVKGLLPFADSNGLNYCVWEEAPDGSRPVVVVGKGREAVLAPSVRGFLELLATGYGEPYSRTQLQAPPPKAWMMMDLAAFRKAFLKAFGSKKLPKDGSAAVAATATLQPAFEAWMDENYGDR